MKLTARRVLVALTMSMFVVGSTAGAVRAASGGALKPDPNGTLRLAATITPTQWNPFRGNSDAVDYQFMSPVYDQLFQFNNKLEPQPSLAESYTISADGKSITLKLRKGVKFQDGTPFNAAAVVANLNYGKANTVAISKPTYDTITAVTQVDEYTVKVDTTVDAKTMPGQFAFHISVGGMVSPTVLAANPASLTTTPSGSGPFKLTGQTQDRATYDKVAKGAYWDAKLWKRLPQHLELISITDENSRLSALQSGQLDAAAILAPVPSKASIVDGRKIKEFQAAASNRMNVIYVNFSNPALAKLEVRQALSMAIDRDNIAKVVELGSVAPSAIPFVKGGAGYNAQAKMAFNTEKAKKLLNDAGYQSLNLTMTTVQIGLLIDQATAIQAQWAKIGVNVQITQTPSSLTQAEWRTGKYDLALRSTNSNPDPQQVVDPYFVGNPVNMPFGEDAAFTALAKKAAALPFGSKERDKAYQEVAQYIAEKPPAIVVAIWPPQIFYHSNVLGIEDLGWSQITSMWDSRHLAIAKS